MTDLSWYLEATRHLSTTSFSAMNHGFDLGSALSVSEPEPQPFEVGLYRKVLQNQDISGKLLLDMGAGRGGLSLFLQSRFPNACKAVSVDILLAHGYLAATAGVQRAATSDCQYLPFRDHTFDLTVCIESLHMYSSRARAIEEATRVTKKDGFVTVADGGDREYFSTLRSFVTQLGARIVSDEDLTSGVVGALLRGRDVRERLYDQLRHGASESSKRFIDALESFLATDAPRMYESGEMLYKVLRFQPPGSASLD